jgi:hypothetical protein
MLKCEISKEFLIEEYVNKGRDSKSISLDFGCHASSIVSLLKKHNIPRRTKSECQITDLKNKRFGKLYVVDFAYVNKAVYWNCKCDCGNSKPIRGRNLVRGHTKSCGCDSHKFKANGGKYLTGQEFANIRLAAKKRNIGFLITISDIEEVYERQNKRCNLTNIDIEFNKRKPYNKNEKQPIIIGNASVDRIESDKPYTKENIQILDKQVNIAKWDSVEKDFIEMCCRVADYARNKK